MTDDGRYDVNFFKTQAQHFKANRNLVLSLALIWAVAVFGFQFLLIALNEETPEKAYTAFQSSWLSVVENSEVNLEANLADKRIVSRAILSVLGKNSTVTPAHQEILKETLSWIIYTISSDSSKVLFKSNPNTQSIDLASETIGLASTGLDKLMTDMLPYALVAVKSEHLNPAIIESLPAIMQKYLVHNQSALTDSKFFGFPFHYWYTAQFLLIMFVVLCLTYAFSYDRLNRKHNLVENS